jgi:6-phosphogluconolactonase (cycloisomerase 2 family)
LTATTAAGTTTGAYQITITGVSGSISETTAVCVEVTSSSDSCSSTASTSGVFYVLNETTNQIVALSISSGKLTTISALTLSTTQAQAIAVAPNGKFLYVSTVYGIYLYAIGSNGALTPGNGGLAISPDMAESMQVDATNSWLVDAIAGESEAQLNAIAINPNTGNLAVSGETEVPFLLPAATVTQLAISPNDSSSCSNCYVFVGMGSGGTEIIHFDPANANPFGTFGTINRISGGGDNAVAVDPTNRLLYVGETAARSGTQTGGLRVFTIASGGVNEIVGSPYAIGGTGPSDILPTSDGDYVYVANQVVSGIPTDNIASFSVSTTSLTPVSTVAAGPTGRIMLAEDSTHSFLLAADFAGDPDLQAYSMSSGTLTSVLSTSTGNDPVGAIAIAAAP